MEMPAVLRSKGYKATPQRLAVFKALARSDEHPTAEMLYKEIRQDFPTLSLATVYKTLEMLTSAGIISQLEAHGGGKRYDANTRPHCHLVCEVCGRMDDLNDDVIDSEWLPRIVERSINSSGFEIDRPELCLFGRCTDCRAKTGL